MEKQITLHEAWRIRYRADRYLRDCPTAKLFARAGDLMTITLQHSMDGKIALSPVGEDSSKMERFIRVLEELAIRRIDYRQPGIVEALRPPPAEQPEGEAHASGPAWQEMAGFHSGEIWRTQIHGSSLSRRRRADLPCEDL
jgi:hypothetical protein